MLDVATVSENVHAAIAELNACSKMLAPCGAVTFKPKGTDAGRVRQVINTGLRELDMGVSASCFMRLTPSAIERLTPLGLDVSQAYDICDAKWMR